MFTAVIHSNKTIDNPRSYANVVFGSYWTDLKIWSCDGRAIQVTVGEECRRLAEMSYNIDIISGIRPGNTWEDGSPCPLPSDQPDELDSWED